MDNEKLKKIVEERASNYGYPGVCFSAIAMAWSAIIIQANQHISELQTSLNLEADSVAAMMAVLKIIRASTGTYHQDNFDDAHIYLNFCEDFQKERN